MIDREGYRSNVGIILLGRDNNVFWGRRKGEDSWQFPQGGIYDDEEPDAAMFRELNEELGLMPDHVRIIAKTVDWLYYDVPTTYARANKGIYRGQKQIWYLLKFLGKDYEINVRFHKEQEFDAWRWINYWEPIEQVVNFKQDVYKTALKELAPHINLG